MKMVKKYLTKKELIEKNLPDFNNIDTLRRFCEKQSELYKQDISVKEEDELRSESRGRAFRYLAIR